jgi:hypothetical protein
MIKRKSIELPPAVGEDFLKDIHAFYATEDYHKRDEFAARQAHIANGRVAFRLPTSLALAAYLERGSNAHSDFGDFDDCDGFDGGACSGPDL